MVKIPQKRNTSSLQVLKTFKLLFQNDYTMEELVHELNIGEADCIFNNMVVCKYINTCRFCGCIIPKIHNKYVLTHIPFGLELSDIESNLLSRLQKKIASDMSKKCLKLFSKLIKQINRYSEIKVTEAQKDEYHFLLEQFERAVTGYNKIRLYLKNSEILDCNPVKIIEQNEKTYLQVYKKEFIMVNIDNISRMETLNETFINLKEDNSVVIYKIYPPMAQRYELRANEAIFDKTSDGCIVITNREESKENLISRLLRYDTCCEILKPDELRLEMKQTIENTLRNYGV